jgi:hypothetical protein
VVFTVVSAKRPAVFTGTVTRLQLGSSMAVANASKQRVAFMEKEWVNGWSRSEVLDYDSRASTVQVCGKWEIAKT